MSGAGWYHCSVKPVSRSAGRSVVAAAAYRLGERLHEHATNQVHDYRRRFGVVTTFTVAPDGAPDWVFTPERLWNEASAAERRKNSTLARECELALPSAVSAEAREAIAREFALELVDRYGVAVSVAIHEPGRRGDVRNFHAHVLMTTRRLDEDGFGAKTRILDDRKSGPQEVIYLRHFAADLINEALERAGSDERVDARSLEARGIDRAPTSHLGPGATEIERKGGTSDRGKLNREAAERNQDLDRIVEELANVEAEIIAEEQRRLDGRLGTAEPDTAEVAGSEASSVADPTFETTAAIDPEIAQEREALSHAAGPYQAQIEREGTVLQQDGLTWWQRAGAVLSRWRDMVHDWIFRSSSSPDRDEPEAGR